MPPTTTTARNRHAAAPHPDPQTLTPVFSRVDDVAQSAWWGSAVIGPWRVRWAWTGGTVAGDTETPPVDVVASAATLLETLSANLKKLAAATGGEAESDAPPPPSLGQATAEAQQVRARFDSLIKWILGAIIGVGALIFGSVPFANLAGVDFWPWGGLGLILAGAGILLVIWGATRAWEPVDSSLGELARSLADIAPDELEDRIGQPSRWAFQRLKKILSDEPEAHLGPGVTSVHDLIKKIKELERDLQALPGNDRGNDAALAGPVVILSGASALFLARDRALQAMGADPELPAAPRSPEVQRAVVAELTARVASAEAVIKRLKEAKDASDSVAVAAAATAALVQEVDAIRVLLEALPTIGEISAAGTAANKRAELRMYLARRQLVLSEALVLQVRSRFLVARRWIGLGAALTLAGGILYAYAIANPVEDDAGLNTIVQATILPDAEDAWATLVGCKAVETDAESAVVRAVLVSSDDADALQNGPFSLLVVDGPCAGKELTVAEGRGIYSPAGEVPGSSGASEEETDAAPTAAAALVTVTLLANTDELDAAVEACGDLDLDPSVTAELTALLMTSDDADAHQDGDFTVTLATPGCEGVTIDVVEPHGTYAPAG
jgi:hypothetical protein